MKKSQLTLVLQKLIKEELTKSGIIKRQPIKEASTDTILYKVNFNPEYSRQNDSKNTPINSVFAQMTTGERTKIGQYAAIKNIGGYGKTTYDKVYHKDRINTTEIAYPELFKLVKSLHKVKFHR